MFAMRGQSAHKPAQDSNSELPDNGFAAHSGSDGATGWHPHHRVGGDEELREVDIAGQDLQQLMAQTRALDRHDLRRLAVDG